MKINKKIMIIMLILCLSVLLLFILTKKESINYIEKLFIRNQQSNNDGISYIIYDNQQIDNLKVLITITRENGIDQIKYIDKNNNERIINCKGKQDVSFDTKVGIGQEYSYEVTSSNGEIKTEKLLLTNEEYQEYLNNIINITSEELENNVKFSAEFNNDNIISKFYKVGNTDTWNSYTGETSKNKLDISLNDIIEGTNKLPIYIKQVDQGGNVVVNCNEIPILEFSMNVFKDIESQGKTLEQYGFTASWENGQNTAFTIGEFKAGHTSGACNWSGTFRWNYPKTKKAKKLYVNFYHWKNETDNWGTHYASTVYSTLKVVYADGTSTTKSNPNTIGNHSVTIELADKNIYYIEMYLYGFDNDYTSSWARVDSIILKGIELTDTE